MSENHLRSTFTSSGSRNEAIVINSPSSVAKVSSSVPFQSICVERLRMITVGWCYQRTTSTKKQEPQIIKVDRNQANATRGRWLIRGSHKLIDDVTSCFVLFNSNSAHLLVLVSLRAPRASHKAMVLVLRIEIYYNKLVLSFFLIRRVAVLQAQRHTKIST